MENKRVLLFGGTTEGRELARFLFKNRVDFTLSVATEYGKAGAEDIPGHIICGRLDGAQMAETISGYTLVIDATHPFASAVTANIKNACEKTGAEYMRVLRGSTQATNQGEVKWFESNSAAVDYLNNTEGNIFLTTGSKNAADFTKIKDFESRVFIRMLPMADGLAACTRLGFKPSNIFCMQGCFSKELNAAMLSMTGAKYLVTKDSGDEGGFLNKLEAAAQAGAEVVVISRPNDETGISIEEAKNFLRRGYIKADKPRFPLFVDLSDKEVVFIGGGNIASRRVKALLEFAGKITVIAPDLTEYLTGLANEKSISWLNREYENGDLKTAWLCVAATDKRQVNAAAAEEAAKGGVLCSVADAADECGFWFPGIIEENNLVVGVVSTDGDHNHVKNAVRRVREAFANEAEKNEAENRKQG